MQVETGRELRARAGIPPRCTRTTNLSPENKLSSYLYRQLLLSKQLDLFWSWFVTVDLKPDEVHSDAINALRDNLPRPYLWSGVHVPYSPENGRHLHLVVSLPSLGAQELARYQRRRNRNFHRSVKSILVYDLGGLWGYLACGRNLGVPGATVLACRAIKQNSDAAQALFDER